ncbi:MAG: triose-phosphate isomerase [Luteibaculaceae bacterium]
MFSKIVAGNWKMNKNLGETTQFFENLAYDENPEVKVVLAVPFPFLNEALQARKSGYLGIAAQNANPKESGAFTGEVSFAMLKDLGVEFCIIGHSERRAMFGDTLEFVREKVESALANKIAPILCVGETLEERYAKSHFAVVKEQLLTALINVEEDAFAMVIIAYEPVWAIGTGQTATTEQAQEMHAYIRKILKEKYGSLASETPILYGGSCNPKNANELFAQPDVNGGLIGGASLKVEDFTAIIAAANHNI